MRKPLGNGSSSSRRRSKLSRKRPKSLPSCEKGCARGCKYCLGGGAPGQNTILYLRSHQYAQMRLDSSSFRQYPVEIHDELLYHCNGEWLTCQVVKIRNTSPPTWRIEYPPHYNCGPGVKPEVVEHAQLCQLRRKGLPKRMPNKVLDFIAEEGNFMVGGRAEVAWRRSQMLRGLHRITERGDRPQGKRSKVNFGDDQVVSFPLKLLPWNTKGSRTKSECEDNAATEGSVGRFA